jgi:hypothetical protein
VLDVLVKFFDIVVDTDAPITDQLLEFHQVDSGDFAGAAEGDAFLLEEGDRDFAHPVGLGEVFGLGQGIGQVDRELHGLGFWVGRGSFVGVGLEIFDHVADVFGGDVYLIGFGVDVKQDDNFGGEDLIDDAIATAFAFSDVAVFGADFEDGITNTGNLVAGNFALFELGDQGLDILADLAVAFGEVADLAFEFVSDEDLGCGGFRHRFRPRDLQRG